MMIEKNCRVVSSYQVHEAHRAGSEYQRSNGTKSARHRRYLQVTPRHPHRGTPCGGYASEGHRLIIKMRRVEGTSVWNISNGTISRNNTSGVRGVSWHQVLGKWQARIGFQGKAYHLGTYDKLEDAVAARKKRSSDTSASFWNGTTRITKMEAANRKVKSECAPVFRGAFYAVYSAHPAG